MRIKTAIVGMLALGLTVGSGVAMAHGGHGHGKISAGGYEGEWNDGDDGGFSNSSLHGIYVLRFSGYQNATSGATNASAPVNGLAILTPDGNGNLSGTEITNTLINSGSGTGVRCSGTLKGTYKVNLDGSGSATAQFTPGTGSDSACGTTAVANDFNFVIVNEHRFSVASSDNTGSWGGDAEVQGD